MKDGTYLIQQYTKGNFNRGRYGAVHDQLTVRHRRR